MIYGRFGDPVTIVRMGTLADVKTLDRRTPDKRDKECIEAGAYVVTLHDDGKERLHHIGYLRADGSIHEIRATIEALGKYENFRSEVANADHR